MNKRISIIITILLGIIAISTPIMISLYMARRQGIEEQMERASLIANEILRRNDEALDEISEAFRKLKNTGSTDPCSDENIRLMASLTISSYQFLSLGYVEGNRLICSAIGRQVPGVPVGPPDYLSSQGMQIRSSVKLPSQQGGNALLVTDAASGYTAMIHREQPINVFVEKSDVSLGLVGYTSKKLLLGRGIFRPEWMQQLGNARHLQRFGKENLVAMQRSDKYDYVAFAAIPISSVNAGIRRLAVVLLPIGVLAGIALALAVLHVAKRQQALPAVLKAALKRKEFFVLYQPVVDLRTRKWIGAEALVRWQRADGEIMRPDAFIPVAEETGLIRKVTERVTEIVSRDAAGLFKQYPDFHIAINLSAADMHSERTVEQLRCLDRDTNAGPGNLIMEATERGFMKADVARDVIRKLRANGIKVAIDDFGTGYSSLAYLETFELDFLKIDKSFIDTIGIEAASSHVILHIIGMAKDLKLEMIAEGVETEAQAQFLAERDVHYAQGWLFAKPLTFAELIAQLQERNAA